MLNVVLRYGVGSHIATKDDLMSKLNGDWKLPDSVRVTQTRSKSVQLVKEKV